MKILYFDCSSGISGDMVVGALLDSGLSIEMLRRELVKLKLEKFNIEKQKVRRGELVGTKFDIKSKVPFGEASHSTVHRSFKEITRLIDKSSLKINIKINAKKIFSNLAAAEKKAHGIKGDNVHFHQLGEIDSIIDIVGVCIGFDALCIDKFYSSPVISGVGVINDKYGVLPNPGPAALNLLKGAQVEFKDSPHELITPTGAAVLKTFCNGFGKMPAMKVEGIGYGAGNRIYPGLPNLLRIVIGKSC